MSAGLHTAVIMAGGEGVRLRPLTYVIPKPLLPVGPYTVLEHLVARLAAQGFQTVRVLASYRFDRFEEAVEPYAERYGIDVHLHRERVLLGTMGGLAQIADELPDAFLLVNADIVIESDFGPMYEHHLERGADLTVGTKRYTSGVPYGVVALDEAGDLVSLDEKPSREFEVSVGAYLVSPGVLRFLDGAPAGVPDVVHRLLAEGLTVASYQLEGLWLDVGQTDDYERAARLLDDVEAEFE